VTLNAAAERGRLTSMRYLGFILTSALSIASCAADEVVLKSGAVLHGEIVRSAEVERDVLTVKLEEGTITLARNLVAQVKTDGPASAEYRRRAPSAPDTVESQWALAEWCRDNNLGDECKRHAQRVVELSPNHEEARTLLGFQREGERWVTRDDMLSGRGLVRYEGAFRTQQEIELLERARHWKQVENEWREKLARWRRQLTRGSVAQREEAANELRALRDPLAGVGLAKWLTTEQNIEILRGLIQIALQVPAPGPIEALAELSLHHPNEEIRQECLEQLANRPSAGLTSRYVKGLKSNDNAEVNRAAHALGYLRAEDALGPLIEALTTEHKVPTGAPQGGGDTYSFSPTSGGFSMGGKQPAFIVVPMNNNFVLSALVELTHKNFQYDKEQWKNWLAAQAQLEQVSIRRDE
jgi:hypothetical protein